MALARRPPRDYQHLAPLARWHVRCPHCCSRCFGSGGGRNEPDHHGTVDPVNKGNGFSDARLVSFDITGLTGSGVFSATFANADAGREQFFLIPEGAGLLAAEDEPPAHAAEPGTLLLLATSMLGVGSAAWCRQRRSPMGGRIVSEEGET
jgi:hypothetical protein